MDLALAIAVFVIGAAAGGLLVWAWMVDRRPINIHSGPDDVEKRARRAF